MLADWPGCAPTRAFLTEIFSGDIRATVDSEKPQRPEGGRTPYAARGSLAGEYARFRRDFELERRSGQRLTLQRRGSHSFSRHWGTSVMRAIIRSTTRTKCPRSALPGGKAGAPALLVLRSSEAEAEGEDPLAFKLHRPQFHG